eukprot:6157827-Amphidinium_carterae.1
MPATPPSASAQGIGGAPAPGASSASQASSCCSMTLAPPLPATHASMTLACRNPSQVCVFQLPLRRPM